MDLELQESGNGGDLVKMPNDLSVIDGFQNMIYLALFGGNVEASTPSKRIDSEQAFDWWGNSLELEDPGLQMNSETERALMSVALNSAGRLKIEQAVKKDINFMKSFATTDVTVTIPDNDQIKIMVSVKRPDNLEERQFIFIWDRTKNEVQI